MSTPAHTPTPWFVQITPLVIRIGPSSKGISAWLDKVLISLPATPENKVIAEQVVRACNSHAALVAALGETAHRLDILSFRLRSTQRPGMPDYVSKESAANIAADIEREARAALAAAKE